LRQLRLVAQIAEVHRTLADEEPFDERAAVMPSIESGVAHWGHLLLLERIGEGSFGEVYHARDAWLDREVALKLFKPTARGTAATARMVQEARTLARIRHPNVVVVHGAAVQDGRVGLWMELLRGQTLEQQLASQGLFGAREAALVGIDLCGALAAIHSAGLVHRDIKAANVMREDGGRNVLMDFGAGQVRETATPTPAPLAGTPLYLAPELLRGERATPRSDIYALGVLLYRLVTGAYPVTAASFGGLLAAHEHAERKYVKDARPDLPEAFITVVERATDPDPKQRYVSAGDMQHALSVVVSSMPSRLDKGPSRLFGRRWLVVMAFLFIAIAATGLSMWRAFKEPLSAVSGHVSLLAVLPFHNLSADTGESYLASAVPMELTARLGQIGALRVVPWTFMARFDPTGQRSLKAVADRTGADAVVEGSVQRLPDAAGLPGPVQVRVQIYEAGTGTLLWSASFERDISDFFALQAQIARDVADRVHVVLAAREQAIVSRTRRVPPEAMEDYLRGRHLLEIEVNLQGAA
jgi:serine/threonine protein kinase